MATVTIPADGATPLLADVFCSACMYGLEPWEVHLLKYLDCPYCGANLELGQGIERRVALHC